VQFRKRLYAPSLKLDALALKDNIDLVAVEAVAA
jgi:hypothetical protein